MFEVNPKTYKEFDAMQFRGQIYVVIGSICLISAAWSFYLHQAPSGFWVLVAINLFLAYINFDLGFKLLRIVRISRQGLKTLEEILKISGEGERRGKKENRRGAGSSREQGATGKYFC